MDGNQLDPLIFTLKIPSHGTRWPQPSVKSTLTVFYDSAGENVMSAGKMDPLARYLESAGGILLLVDPMQMPRVRDTLRRTRGILAHGQQVLDQGAVVQRLAELLRERAKRGKGKLGTPLAIAITKIDTLRDTFEDHSPMQRTPSSASSWSTA